MSKDEQDVSSAGFSTRYRFSAWPNALVPLVSAGTYAVWDGETLIYCGMSGRQFDPTESVKKRKYGLFTRLASHASGRLSGDQFCVYVANRLVLPTLSIADLPLFATGQLNLDQLTRRYIHDRLEYQFAIADTAAEAFDVEARCRSGQVFGLKPILNPWSP